MTISISDNRISLFVKALGLYFMLLILGAMNIGSVGSMLRLIGLIPVVIWFFEKKKVYLNKFVQYVGLFTIWIFTSTLFSIDRGVTLERGLTQLSFLLLIISASTYIYRESEIQFLKRMLVMSSRLSAIILFLFAGDLYGRAYLNGVIKEDPNYFVGYLLFGIIFATQQLLDPSLKLKQKILYALELIAYLYLSVETGSRGGLLAVIIAVAITLLFYDNTSVNSKKKFLYRVLFFLLIVLFYFIVEKYVSVDLLSRLTVKSVLASEGSGRVILWKDGLAAFFSYGLIRKFIGYGSGSILRIASAFGFIRVQVMHNIFLEVLLELGIIGLVLYLAEVIVFLKHSIKMRDYYSISILFGYVILSLSLSLYAYKPYWNIMIFIVCLSRRIVDNKL